MDAVTKPVISKLSQSDFGAWNSYVDGHEEGTFFHLAQWQNIMQETFKFPSHYLMAKDADDNVTGLLPLVEVKSFLFGHSLVSTPFCVYGGVIADNDLVKRELEQAAVTLAEELQVDQLELRYKTEQNNDFLVKSQHSYFDTELAEDHDKILLAIKKKQRAVVRHSLKNELEVSANRDLEDFFNIYSTSVRNLGTPVFAKKYFKQLLETFQDECDIYSVSKDGETVSSVMNFYYKGEVLPYYGGGTYAARGLKSNDHMYYKLMCHAFDKGCTKFDFGRSKNDSGAFKYKSTWGMEAKPLFYYYHLVKAKELPNLSPNNPKYQMFIKLWQKLPLKVSQMIGPFLSKYLG